MTTLRRELRDKFKEILNSYMASGYSYLGETIPDEIIDKLADATLELRGLQFKSTITEEIKEDILENSDPAWSVLAGVQVKQETIDKNVLLQISLQTFETDMGCPKNWKWEGATPAEEKVWKELREFVVEKYSENTKCFQTYQTWRTQPFARGAMSNLAIKKNPENFPASWTDFLASNAMYGKKDAVSKPTLDESGNVISY